MSLKELQTFMQEMICSDRYEKQDIESIEQFVAESPKRSALDSLKVYQTMYFVRVWDCLTEDYPMIHQILGDQEFDLICKNYIKKYPSNSFTLERLGDSFYKFLAEEKRPLLSSIAQYEYAAAASILKKRDPRMNGSPLEAPEADVWQKKILCLASHVYLLNMDYDISSLIRDYEVGSDIKKYTQGGAIKKNLCSLLVFTGETGVNVFVIDQVSLNFLSLFRRNNDRCLEDIVDDFLLETNCDDLGPILSSFNAWVGQGIIVEKANI